MKKPEELNITRHRGNITRSKREALNQHKGAVLWFTGLSGSGKSTLAHALEDKLYEMGCRTMVLDGDNVRHGLCGDLGFSDEDRKENIRRISEVANLFMEAGMIILTAFISPFLSDRKKAKELIGEEDFFEIYCDCPLETCEDRDVKGLYKKAKQGEIKNFTGISSPYEPPVNPHLTLKSGARPLQECVDELISFLQAKEIIR